ncbi:TPR domain-containing glycosyltransferase [Paramaledivibacter caminithermalis]|uniref:Glycosyltransferase involved in cell wall bisynthesis n=1 Tax=Paramaledivibacter caminithermalis (strain DSM 15212 / CIP 107654 / DViRD3) TaxID=1121301 RepID=A0A1M6LZP1_PARC5|nr:TPR domain-containing glycosyltransferase [Paramaledivibacter caminithermalis]SHJ76590.1 Glycosyltransferase involved in cell wall bisynthesis [Paramaledivibacter caminithermalis DSM 15212]
MKRNRTVSLCMIVKNEEKHLERCLSSVKELVDEMIIVDTGSRDNTVEIAKKFNAKIFYYDWDDNFSNARNFSIQHATKDWILLMDGDDEFNKEDYEKYTKVINDSKKDGHYFKTLSFVGNIPSNDVVSNLNLRLLRNNKKYKFIGAIHEQITCVTDKMDYKNFSTEDIRIFHYGYLNNVAIEKNKRNRNISIIEEELKANPHNPFHLFNLGNEYFAMGNKEKALKLFNSVYDNLNWNDGFASKLVIRRIMCLDELGKYGEALQAIEEGLKIYPEFTDLELIRGWIHLKNKKYTLAIDSFNKCLELGEAPSQLEFLNGCGTFRPYQALGEIYFQFEDYYKSLECFEEVLKLNPYLQNPIYKIGALLNKLYDNKRYVSYKLSQYFNLEHVSNLLLISDVLITEGLYDLAKGYLEKAKELEENNQQVNFQINRILFYQKKYTDALSGFNTLSKKSNEYKESLKYIFICGLITDTDYSEEVLNYIKNGNESFLYRVYLQLYNVFLGENKAILLEEDDHEKALKLIMKIIVEVLKAQEFELFEKLLHVLNYLESNRVLLELAAMYHNNGFKEMAVKEILRSIKELNAIDAKGVEILYKEIR